MRSLSVGSVWADRGFGLVEVLVAVAVFGLLAAIMVPVAQQRQRATAEASALEVARQVQLGMERFAADRGAYPTVEEIPGAQGNGRTFGKPLSVVLGAYGRLAGEEVKVQRYTLIGGIYRMEVSIAGREGDPVWQYTITPSTITSP